MNGRLAVLVAAAMVTVMAANAAPALGKPEVLRVALLRYYRGITQVTILASSDFAVLDSSGGALASGAGLEPITLSVGNSSITLERANGTSARLPASVTVRAAEPGALLSVKSPGRVFRKYRGSIQVDLVGDSLRLVNVVDLEDYLLGVVPAEIPSSFPTEAIKAQAVAARTYAAASLGRRSALGYDLCDTRYSQVYEGQLGERPVCSRAVMDTAGITLTYGGRPAETLYCSDCGGVTRRRAETNPREKTPYLDNVREPPELQHAVWEKQWSLVEIGQRLAAAGIGPMTGLREIRVDKSDSSGRALTLILTGDSGSITVSADTFRAALGQELRSTMFVIEPSSEGAVIFRGKGSGHGYGLCQAGARGLALPPFDYTFDRILAHYYPGTTLVRE